MAVALIDDICSLGTPNHGKGWTRNNVSERLEIKLFRIKVWATVLLQDLSFHVSMGSPKKLRV